MGYNQVYFCLRSGTIDFVIGEYGSSPMHDFDVGLE